MAAGGNGQVVAGTGRAGGRAMPKAPPPPPAAPDYSREYSAFVKVSKIGLVLLAIVLLAVVAIWPNINTSGDRFQLRAAFISGFENEKPNMHNARYFGVDNSRQPYSITADLAENLVEGSARVELERPQADIALEDGTWMVLTANTGVYAGEEKQLDLIGKVNLFHDSGYEFRTSKAAIDLASGSASGNEPVAGHGPFGELTASGFKLIDKGRVIYFDGPATLTMYPGTPGTGPGADAGTKP